MSDEALKHKEHDLDFYMSGTVLGRFVHVYCNSCKKELGNINIANLLDDIELEEEDDEENIPNLLKSQKLEI